MSLSISEPAAVRPETQSRIGDEEYIFAINVIVSVSEFLGAVMLKHGVEIGVAEADALDFLLREVSGTPRNLEAAFGRCVDEMSGSTEIAGEILVGIDRSAGCGSAAIAVFAAQCVDGFVFAELLYAWGQDDQVGAIGQHHAGAIDGFVAQPCGV